MTTSKRISASGSGKVRAKSVAAARKRVRDSDLYFILRDGALFRPEAKGYTDDIAAAGSFVGARAKGYLNVEGVELLAVRDTLPRLKKDMRDHVAAAHRLNDLIQQFD